MLDVVGTVLYYKIRRDGTNEFVSKIDTPNLKPYKVEFVKGWGNSKALLYKTLEDANTARKLVLSIEGFHTVVEQVTNVAYRTD